MSEIVKKHQSRPVNLDLTTVRFPISAIASICHRISGVINLFVIGGLLWLLSLSLSSEDGFEQAALMLQSPLVSFVLWALLSILSYHLLAGLRHLIMDAGYGEELETGMKSAKLIFVLSIVVSVGWGVILW